MNWTWVGLCLLTFGITYSETAVSTWAAKADRNSTSSRTDVWSRKAAGWEGVFEAILTADMWLVINESPWLAIPAIAAAMIGKYVVLERRRKKWRAKVKTPKRRKRGERQEGVSEGA